MGARNGLVPVMGIYDGVVFEFWGPVGGVGTVKSLSAPDCSMLYPCKHFPVLVTPGHSGPAVLGVT